MFLNKAFLVGNLTRDPELKALPSGSKVCSFALATNRKFKDKDGALQESTEFHNIVAFGRQGELAAQYLKKGSQALIEGRIQNRSWDKQDGTKGYRSEIVAETIQFGSRPGASGAAATTPTGSVSNKEASDAPGESSDKDKIEYPQEEINPNDIPF